MIRKATVEGGVVVGIPAADPRITAFKGIPFAAPPVGENRWRAPQPVIPWEGEKVCYQFAPISMQHIPGLDKDNIYSREWNVDPEIPMDEDCLYLNVWTPAKSADEKLPVFVWYFGGGLREGNPAEMEFDGERLARRGIVVVTVNYRLNVFGFLAHPQLVAEQPDAPTNFGHLDQRAGTLWVKNNIAAFGGDPNNITIGGQSAGGGSVCAQLTSPLNEGLFQKAIIMSGIMANVLPNPMRFGGGDPLEQGKKIFEYLGVETLEEARKIPAVELRDKFEASGFYCGTSVDGVFATDDSMSNIMKGNRYKVPLIISRTSSEFLSFVRAQSEDELKNIAETAFGDKADEFLAVIGTDPAAAEKASAHSSIEVGARAIADRSEKLGIEAPVYYSVFDPSIPGWDNPGTFHSSDLWFVFETLAKCWRPFKGYHLDLARQMCNYWANFVKTGNPNGEDADGTPMPEWKPLTTAEPNSIWFQDEGPKPMVDEPSKLMALLTDAFLKQH